MLGGYEKEIRHAKFTYKHTGLKVFCHLYFSTAKWMFQQHKKFTFLPDRMVIRTDTVKKKLIDFWQQCPNSPHSTRRRDNPRVCFGTSGSTHVPRHPLPKSAFP